MFLMVFLCAFACIPAICIASCSSLDKYELRRDGTLTYTKVISLEICICASCIGGTVCGLFSLFHDSPLITLGRPFRLPLVENLPYFFLITESRVLFSHFSIVMHPFLCTHAMVTVGVTVTVPFPASQAYACREERGTVTGVTSARLLEVRSDDTMTYRVVLAHSGAAPYQLTRGSDNLGVSAKGALVDAINRFLSGGGVPVPSQRPGVPTMA